MKVMFEEYGEFIISIFIGLICIVCLYAFTINHKQLMNKLVPDEQARNMMYLKNTEVLDSKKIPVLSVEDSMYLYYGEKFDPTSKKVIDKATDGTNELDLTDPTNFNLIPAAEITNKDAYRNDVINVTGWDQVQNNTKGETKVIYTYTNSRTKYKNEAVCLVVTRIPYKNCDYIETDGSQIIDTKVKPSVGGTYIKLKYEPSAVSGTRYVMTANRNNEKNAFKYSLLIKDGTWCIHLNEGKTAKAISTKIRASAGVVYTIDFNRTYIKINGTKVDILEYLKPIDAKAAMSIHLFGSPYNGTDTKGVGKLYYCKIYEGPHLKRDYIPVYGKRAGRFGLWDKVEWKFYKEDLSSGNQLSGEISKTQDEPD